MIELLHPVSVRREEKRQMLLTHFMYPDTVRGVVNYHLMPAVTIYCLLKTKGEIGIIPIIPQNGIEIFYDAKGPVTFFRYCRDRWRRFAFIATAERTGFHMLTIIIGNRRLLCLRAKASRGSNKH
jgi:hypothetical protein